MTRRARRDKKHRNRNGNASANPQAGRALVKRIAGDALQINHPDGGAPPLTPRVMRYQKQGHNGFGSHMNGKHKQG